MGGNAIRLHNRVAFRVSSIERAGEFYNAALGCAWLVKPFTMKGAFAEQVIEEPDADYRIAMMAMKDGGGLLEFYEFVHPWHPTGFTPPSQSSHLFFAVWCDDVHETLAQVEAAGGRRTMEPFRSEPATIAYCADPDGNRFELIDQSMMTMVETLNAAMPETRP